MGGTLWLISSRFFFFGFSNNKLPVGRQKCLYRVQAYSAFHVYLPVVVQSDCVLINYVRQAMKLRDFQSTGPHLDNVTIRFKNLYKKSDCFCESFSLCKSAEDKETLQSEFRKQW